ncbi:uncharacterized protein [Physcomitrium patens]|uniref:Uncharacterized protein n=1 Tax=Physcomitrium patens TaxID=3218 RepID=A0A2K1KW18_PHYPA|nr:uncharacterized protein LOC112279729 [Physcomitrium patens]PNR57992.1 hypothetical protein PHYPA_004987 [Physcomitrium patens]|eukprot:XP_024370175.1 uncharacterized protein LOC112279729 [Physcomitrella patens]
MAGVVIRVCTTWGRVFSLMPRQAVGAVIYSNVDAARGVGPVKGAENDPATRGNAPDDRRAGDIHIAEPKEITKKKVAEVSGEPEGLQVGLEFEIYVIRCCRQFCPFYTGLSCWNLSGLSSSLYPRTECVAGGLLLPYHLSQFC